MYVEETFMKILNKLVGREFNQLFQQFNGDMIIINFGENIEQSLHAQCFVRISKNNRILLTTSDVYFNLDYTQKCDEDKDGNLLDYNIDIVNKLLYKSIVTKVVYNKLGDVTIYFDCGVKIELIMDCLFKGFEYYRFIIYTPHYCDDLESHKSTHYIYTLQNNVFVEEQDNFSE